jgi:hypothetical protein
MADSRTTGSKIAKIKSPSPYKYRSLMAKNRGDNFLKLEK